MIPIFRNPIQRQAVGLKEIYSMNAIVGVLGLLVSIELIRLALWIRKRLRIWLADQVVFQDKTIKGIELPLGCFPVAKWVGMEIPYGRI